MPGLVVGPRWGWLRLPEYPRHPPPLARRSLFREAGWRDGLGGAPLKGLLVELNLERMATPDLGREQLLQVSDQRGGGRDLELCRPSPL